MVTDNGSDTMKKELYSLFRREDFSKKSKPLVVFDMANNHNGDVNHGLSINETFI